MTAEPLSLFPPSLRNVAQNAGSPSMANVNGEHARTVSSVSIVDSGCVIMAMLLLHALRRMSM